jgi:hypothetical protein
MPKFVKACKQSRFIPIGHPPLGLSGLLWSISSERKTARANQSGPSTLRPFCAIIAIPRAGSLSKGLEAIRVEIALGTVSLYGLIMSAIIVGVQDQSPKSSAR